MSTGEPVTFKRAREIALEVGTRLQPLCARINTAGSLRRKRPFIHDLEMVCQPLTATDLLGEVTFDVAPIRAVCAQLGEIEKGGGKYSKVRNVLGSGLSLDLFIVTPPANYWCILAIRTGPSGLSKFAVSEMWRHGYHHKDGRVLDVHNREVPINSEEDFFRCAGLPCLPPVDRDKPEAMAPLPASPEAVDLLRKACL